MGQKAPIQFWWRICKRCWKWEHGVRAKVGILTGIPLSPIDVHIVISKASPVTHVWPNTKVWRHLRPSPAFIQRDLRHWLSRGTRRSRNQEWPTYCRTCNYRGPFTWVQNLFLVWPDNLAQYPRDTLVSTLEPTILCAPVFCSYKECFVIFLVPLIQTHAFWVGANP